MDPAVVWQIVILVILLVLSAFFSAAETSLTSVSRITVRTKVLEGNKRAELVEKLITNPSKMLSAILIGNNVANISASALATSAAIKLFGNAYTGIATGVLTLLVLIFGEITPKNLATLHSEKIAFAFAPAVNAITVAFTPLIFIVNKMAGFIMKFLGVDMKKKKLGMTENELRTVVDVSSEQGVIEKDEREMITNVVDFGDSVAKDVMVPRVDMSFANINMSYSELMNVFRDEKYSRLPVYSKDTDHIVGIVNLKDVCFAGNQERQFRIRNFLRPAYFTYEFKKTSDLLKEMRRKSIPLSIVLDEYGATAGLITLEDLLEEIVGDIKDEYDADEQENVRRIADDTYVADGTARLDEINEATGLNLESDDYDSIAGHIIHLLDHLPKEGESVKSENVTYVVSKLNNKRIDEVKLIFDRSEDNDGTEKPSDRQPKNDPGTNTDEVREPSENKENIIRGNTHIDEDTSDFDD